MAARIIRAANLTTFHRVYSFLRFLRSLVSNGPSLATGDGPLTVHLPVSFAVALLRDALSVSGRFWPRGVQLALHCRKPVVGVFLHLVPSGPLIDRSRDAAERGFRLLRLRPLRPSLCVALIHNAAPHRLFHDLFADVLNGTRDALVKLVEDTLLWHGLFPPPEEAHQPCRDEEHIWEGRRNRGQQGNDEPFNQRSVVIVRVILALCEKRDYAEHNARANRHWEHQTGGHDVAAED